MVQTGLIMGGGDVFSQVVIENPTLDQFELSRSIRFALLGTIYVGPVIRLRYLTLEKWFGSHVSVPATVIKVFIDQFGFAPFFTSFLLCLIGLSQGKDVQGIKKKLKNEFYDVMTTGWKVWPAFQLFNFYFTPFLLRPLLVNIAAFFWNSYLAWKTNGSYTF